MNINAQFFAKPRKTPTVAKSRWLDKPRDGFTQHMQQYVREMSNSPEARHTSSLIVGHTGRTR